MELVVSTTRVSGWVMDSTVNTTCVSGWARESSSSRQSVPHHSTIAGVSVRHPLTRVVLTSQRDVSDSPSSSIISVSCVSGWARGSAVTTTCISGWTMESAVSTTCVSRLVRESSTSPAVSGYAYYSTIASALNWAADHGARVANISFMVSDSSAVTTAAKYFQGKGGVVTSSPGNYSTFDSTADNPYILTISATDQNDVIYSYSNTGNNIDVAAPGDSFSTQMGGGYYRSEALPILLPLSLAWLRWSFQQTLISRPLRCKTFSSNQPMI